jgi:hypothetical protein
VSEHLPTTSAKRFDFRQTARHAETAETFHSKGGVKEVQEILGNSRPDRTANVYMQAIEESVKQTQDAIQLHFRHDLADDASYSSPDRSLGHF